MNTIPVENVEPVDPVEPELVQENPPKHPRVCIVGRPNVGKSTLLNRLCGSRVSIVEPTAGVTRDRISVPARLFVEEGERWVEMVDTGGIGIVDRDDLGPHVEEQVATAMQQADLVLFVVDVRDGITPLDKEVAARLRLVDIPVLLVVNKVESDQFEFAAEEFRALGYSDGPYSISAQEGKGMGPLRQRMVDLLPNASETPPPVKDAVMKLAVVGRRNAGKSTLINALAREERMIVSEIPGTTRDAVDVMFERDGETLVAIDTAGVRKKSKLSDAIEFYSEARAEKSIRRADVVVLLFDAFEPIASLEKTLGRFIVDRHKPVILAGNKWDLVGDEHRRAFHEYLEKEMPGLSFATVRFLAAKTGRGVEELITEARALYERGKERVSTGELNRVLKRALETRGPSSKGYRVRLRYATQAEISPPTFVLFVNDKRLFSKTFVRFIQNRIREELPFEDVPVRIVLRDKHEGFEGP